jgi:hypothetical protein
MPTLALLLALPAFATTVDRDLPDFHALCAEAGVQVEVAKADKPHVPLELDNIEPDEVLTELDDGCLRIAPRKGKHRDAQIKATVGVPALDSVVAAAGASVRSSLPLSGETAKVAVAAGATADLPIQAASAEVAVAAGASATLRGKVDRLEVAAAAGAHVDATALHSRDASAVAAAGASTRLHVTERLEASAVAGGMVRYAGSPASVDKSEIAGGSVLPLD